MLHPIPTWLPLSDVTAFLTFCQLGEAMEKLNAVLLSDPALQPLGEP